MKQLLPLFLALGCGLPPATELDIEGDNEIAKVETPTSYQRRWNARGPVVGGIPDTWESIDIAPHSSFLLEACGHNAWYAPHEVVMRKAGESTYTSILFVSEACDLWDTKHAKLTITDAPAKFELSVIGLTNKATIVDAPMRLTYPAP